MCTAAQKVLVPMRNQQSRQRLYPARVLEADHTTLVLHFPTGQHPRPGQRTELFLHTPTGEFERATATIQQVLEPGRQPVVQVRFITKPVQCDRRLSLRVELVDFDQYAEINGGAVRVRIVDVGAEGLGVHSTTRLRVDESIGVAISIGGRKMEGCARVSNEVETSAGYRYGLSVSESESALRVALDGLMWTALNRLAVVEQVA